MKPITINKLLFTLLITLLILVLLIHLTNFFTSYSTTTKYNTTTNKETMVSISPAHEHTPSSYQRNKCDYIMGDTIKNIIDKHQIKSSPEDWQLYLPCGYDEIQKEIEEMPIKKGAKYHIIDNSDTISAKEWLWLNVLKHHGLTKAQSMLPPSYVLYIKDDITRFNKEFNPQKTYIMKKNIQRQEGLKITKDKNEILQGYKQGYVLVQELLQDPYIIDGRKTNMRFYVLVICQNKEIDVYLYNDGFMYYTKKPFQKNTTDPDTNITTGYIEREVYENNPLTHNDFRTYLDNPTRPLSYPEHNIRNQHMQISSIVFDRITQLFRDVFISFVGSININPKLQNNITFQLFGADIAVNDQLQPIIIEINKGCNLQAHDKRDSDLKHAVVEDMLATLGIIPNNNKNGFIKILDISDGKVNNINNNNNNNKN